jgi:Holin of 3TMs, for gene-transfer release
MSKNNDNWMQTLWRPAMGWMYMLICMLDMAVFPVLWALWQGVNHVPITQWNPLTLQGAGLFHIAMGAVLGISAFGRTQEKLAGTAINPSATSQTMTNNTNMSGVPSNMGMNNNMGMGGMNSSFGGNSFGGSNSFGSSPSFGGSPTLSTPPTITPPPVAAPTSSKSAVPTTSFPPL